MQKEYIMVELAVDRSLEEPCVCGGTYSRSIRTCKIGVSQICVCGVVIYRCDPSWYGNFASDWGIAGSP